MTKRRRPLTFELALTKIAAVIGWDECARILHTAESTVRAWGDPDVAACIRLDAALQLDVAYLAAGGQGPAPMHQVYSTRLEADTARACADLAVLQAKVARAAKEHGEAVAFTIAAAQPGASDADLARAELELEESIAASTDTLATLRAGRRGEVQPTGGRSEGDAAARPGEGKQ